jgi:prephenate dehydratase
VTTIAFLGPEGTFAHQAARALPISADADLQPAGSVLLAIDAVRAGSADAALVPLENSVEGAVPATLDELARGGTPGSEGVAAGGGAPLVIADEVYLPVSFNLFVRAGTSLADVHSVATHPHAEAQVRRWLRDTLPGVPVSLIDSTAAGAAAVAAGTYDAAISAPLAGELYGLTALATDVADNPGAVTRFVLLTRPAAPAPRTGNDRTSLVAYLRDDHAGALLEILTEFASRAVNLTRIESRPTKGRIGDYCFSIDCEGHIEDERVGNALAALHRVCADVRYLGSYPRRDGRQGPVPAGRTDQEFVDSHAWLTTIRERGRE